MSKKATVTVKEGKVRGIKCKSSFSSAEYYSFHGIPYGQSTAGNARFKDPMKVKPWTGVYDATTERDGCLQYSVYINDFCGTEDCLYNNVHTPELPGKNTVLKPVVVNVHPGGGFHGSPDAWCYGSPEYVMHRDIVYVCVGLRLHILGFLNLDLPECSGNQGLKDIILSLKWIRDNISAFGGDPENVTLLGSSSGSVLVHGVMLSPASVGLFHKVVAMGSYLFNPTHVNRASLVNLAFEVAYNCGYEGTDPNDRKKLLAFFKRLDVRRYLNLRIAKTINKSYALAFPCSLFGVTMDRGKNAVLPVPWRELIATAPPVPLMFGICEREAVMAWIDLYKENTLRNFDTILLQNCMGWAYGMQKEELNVVNEKIRSFYLKSPSQSIETATLETRIDIVTDMAYSDIYDTLIDPIAVRLPSSVFVYKFQFDGKTFNMKDTIARMLEAPVTGTFHGTDFTYWSHLKDNSHAKSDTLSGTTVKIIETFTKLISTFARTGGPNYKGLPIVWSPTTPDHPCYLNIDEPLTFVQGKLNSERMKFWETLKEQHDQTSRNINLIKNT